MKLMNHLLTLMFGNEFFVYEYNEKKVCMVADDSKPSFKYSAEQWNEEYDNMIIEGTTINAEGTQCIATLFCNEALLLVTISEGPHATVGISLSSLLLFLSLMPFHKRCPVTHHHSFSSGCHFRAILPVRTFPNRTRI